jgi:hypothetical protein
MTVTIIIIVIFTTIIIILIIIIIFIITDIFTAEFVFPLNTSALY